MTSRSLGFVTTAAIMLFSIQTLAQVSVSCLQTPRIEIGFGAYCTPVAPQETICVPYGDTPGLGGCACGRPKASCPPSNCPAEGCGCPAPPPPTSGNGSGSGNGNGGSPSNPECGKPISIASGKTYIVQNDIRQLPGLGSGIALGRTWNSIWPASQASLNTGIFGVNWRSTFEERVFVGDDGYIKYARANGSFWSFGVDSSGNYALAAPSTGSASLTNSNTTWTVTFQSGEQRIFDINSGNLISIVDRNGNATQISYDGYGRLSEVTDPLGRNLIFQYGTGNYAYLVAKVTTSVGHAVTYSYDTQQRLVSVTETDGTVFNFQYNDPNPNLITVVTDINGKILEAHTYDSTGRGLTSVRANGVESITVSYQNQ